MAKTKGSGRGWDAIFADNSMEDTKKDVTKLRLSEIEPEPTQPRSIFDHEPLEELASSIATHGLLQPIIVRAGKNGYYRIVAGERRWRASKMAGLTEVPVVVIDVSDREAAELSLIENLQRENLNPIEEALAYRALIEEYDLTQMEVSDRIGKSRVFVSNTMRLLDLPEETLELVKKNALSAGHARALLGLRDKTLLNTIAKQVVSKELSVRATEELVRSINKKGAVAEKTETKAEIEVNYILDLEKRVTSQLGRQFKIHTKGKKKKIELEYSDENDLERIIKQLCGSSFFED
ncbi:MAG: ParB/RepB/Spo0J family partition protein [Clostridia bacterium]|nr:ParB/RepB/Spo0J family partition protein [Clostridia bacterium]